MLDLWRDEFAAGARPTINEGTHLPQMVHHDGLLAMGLMIGGLAITVWVVFVLLPALFRRTPLQHLASTIVSLRAAKKSAQAKIDQARAKLADAVEEAAGR